MTVNVDLSTLKRVKNSVIGNPTAKAAYAKDENFILKLVECITNPLPYLESSQGSQDDIRIEAAHVVSSLSYGSTDALKSLLTANAHQAFVYAISNLQPTDQPALKAAFARALKALGSALADVVGPSQMGIHDYPVDLQEDARNALDYLFEVEVLDIYLPHLVDSSQQTVISIAQLLASALRSQPYRAAVSEWLPQAERHKEVKGKRGWEKTDTANPLARQGGWVAKELVSYLNKKDSKLQEAALSALASLAKENPSVASKLAKSVDQPSPLNVILSLCKSRLTDLQVAACLCIIRSGIPSYVSAEQPTAKAAAMTVIHSMNNLISSDLDVRTRTKACFVLCHLVSDDKDLCQLAYERGSLNQLADLVKSITPSEPNVQWDEDEPESQACLREAAFTTIASIALFDNDIRCEITDNLRLIPYIQASLTHRHVGVRYSACQCARALSRAVAVLRTNIVDTGLGLAVYRIFLKEDEDKRVTYAASAVVCNLVNDFSPLRSTLLEKGVIPRLVHLLHSGDPGFRLNALWTFKNLLYKSSTEVKRQVMEGLGWHELSCLLMDSDLSVQEQAFHVVRHLADGEEGIEMVFVEMGEQVLLGSLSIALESENENVVCQAVCVLGNLANSMARQDSILTHPRILSALRNCLVDAKVEVRRPAASCILELVRANPHSRELYEAGIDSTLRHICEHSSGLSGSPTTRLAIGFQMGAEDDREVKEKCREALQWLEHGSDML
ncbi:unnamed protein product [Somion occarium]|uniref:Armadillo repeat-containing protein 8 n=1 Tax=Somion occarium TaxID=3059160 RepID=A0ABP1DCB8_9APHY